MGVVQPLDVQSGSPESERDAGTPRIPAEKKVKTFQAWNQSSLQVPVCRSLGTSDVHRAICYIPKGKRAEAMAPLGGGMQGLFRRRHCFSYHGEGAIEDNKVTRRSQTSLQKMDG